MTELEQKIFNQALKILPELEYVANKSEGGADYIKLPFLADGVQDTILYDRKLQEFTEIRYIKGVGSCERIFSNDSSGYFDKVETCSITIPQEYRKTKYQIKYLEGELYYIKEVRFIVGNYISHIRDTTKTGELPKISFNVYPVQNWIGSGENTGTSGYNYFDLVDESQTKDSFEFGKCLKELTGVYYWRGSWEESLEFPHDDYTGYDLETLSKLYNEFVAPYCKTLIETKYAELFHTGFSMRS